MVDIIDDQEARVKHDESKTVRLTEQLSPEEIWQKCLEWHDYFDNNIWKKESSFHNRSHVEAVVDATDTYLHGYSEDNDPLELKASLNLWNETNPRAVISDSELQEAIRFAVYSHDTGNIMTSFSIKKDELVPDFLPIYTAGEDVSTGKIAEERSQDITQLLIENSSLEADKKRRFIPFVRHLINETKFMQENLNSPFSKFMRVMDQIGNDLHSMNEKRVVGLLNEIEKERPDATANPHFFINFARERIAQLVPDESDRNKLLSIWGKKLPGEIQGLSHEQIPVSKVKEIAVSI